MDMQPAILQNLPDVQPLISNAGKAIAFARENNIPVIFVVVGFRKGVPEISKNNKSFSQGKERFLKMAPENFMKIHSHLTPTEDEVVVTKRRISAFAGSDLEIVLRAGLIQHLVLTGISTSGVVLSTLREAADKDFQLTVISDCCADADPEVHRVLRTKVFPRQAEVLTLEEWMKL